MPSPAKSDALIRDFWRAPANPTSPIGRAARLINTRKRRAPSSRTYRRRRRTTFRTGRTAPSSNLLIRTSGPTGSGIARTALKNYRKMMTTTFHHHIGPTARSYRKGTQTTWQARSTDEEIRGAGRRGAETKEAEALQRREQREQAAAARRMQRAAEADKRRLEREAAALVRKQQREAEAAKKDRTSAPEGRPEGHRPHQRGLGAQEPQGGRGARTR